MPVLRTLTKYDLTLKATARVMELIEPIVESHRQTLDRNNIRDFLDTMLIEAEVTQDPKSPFEAKLAPATIRNSILDLVVGGMETTSSSLVQIFLHVLHHPEVQVKVHMELDTVSIISLFGYRKSYDLISVQ